MLVFVGILSVRIWRRHRKRLLSPKGHLFCCEVYRILALLCPTPANNSRSLIPFNCGPDPDVHHFCLHALLMAAIIGVYQPDARVLVGWSKLSMSETSISANINEIDSPVGCFATYVGLLLHDATPFSPVGNLLWRLYPIPPFDDYLYAC